MSQPPDETAQDTHGGVQPDQFAEFAREAEAAVDEALAPLEEAGEPGGQDPAGPALALVAGGSAPHGSGAGPDGEAGRAGSGAAARDARDDAPDDKVLSFQDHRLRRLHERNVLLATRMRELVGLARENEQLSAHLHRLSIALLGADRLDEACARVYTTLREDVGVEMAVIALYAAPKRKLDAGLDELRAPDDPVRLRFDHVFERNLPVCGPLSPEAARELVGLRGGDFCSAALVPLGVRPFGLLALLSRDPDRYHASMGKVVLRRMSELLAVAFARHLRLPGGA